MAMLTNPRSSGQQLLKARWLIQVRRVVGNPWQLKCGGIGGSGKQSRNIRINKWLATVDLLCPERSGVGLD